MLDLIGSGAFSNANRDLFRPVVDSLLDRDEYLPLADYQSYVDQQDQVSPAFSDPGQWTNMSILNVSRMGHFLLRPLNPGVLRLKLGHESRQS